jgi:3D (Asp-Asp-Asp) domain-containing protein
VLIPHGVGYLDKTCPENDRVFTIDDTGGAIRRNTRRTGRVHIDLRFIQHRNALRFGVKRIKILVYKD